MDAIRKRIPRGKVLINENNPANEALLRAHLRKYRLRAYHAPDLATAKNLLIKKHMLGLVLDHNFRADPAHTGLDLLRFIRKEREELRGFPVFLVTSVNTDVLMEYEYLKINRYFDTENNRVSFVVRETEPYFIERD
jgi:CheY-like chemotaxis protein